MPVASGTARDRLRRSGSTRNTGVIESATLAMELERQPPPLPIELTIRDARPLGVRPLPKIVANDANRLSAMTEGFFQQRGFSRGATVQRVTRSDQSQPTIYGGSAYKPQFMSAEEINHYEHLVYDCELIRQKTNRVEYQRTLKRLAGTAGGLGASSSMSSLH